jgi:hypothetical protein
MELIYGGAGVLPYSISDSGKVFFLFQKSVEGKKANQLVDFGGAKKPEENQPALTAAREFSEETGGLFVCENLEQAAQNLQTKSQDEIENSECVQQSIKRILQKIESGHNVWVSRTPQAPGYVMFFVMIEHISLTVVNRVFNTPLSSNKRRKQKEFFWISSQQIRTNTLPHPLYARVTAIANLFELIEEIAERFERDTSLLT